MSETEIFVRVDADLDTADGENVQHFTHRQCPQPKPGPVIAFCGEIFICENKTLGATPNRCESCMDARPMCPVCGPIDY